MQNALISPISNAARNAPGIEPRPPTTTTTKASETTDRSISKFAGSRGIASAPPRPARLAPRANTAVNSQRWFTPSAPVISRSSVAARIRIPKRVRVSRKCSSANTAGPSMIRNRSYFGNWRPAISIASRKPGARGPSRSSAPQAQSAKSLITSTRAKVASSCSSSGARYSLRSSRNSTSNPKAPTAAAASGTLSQKPTFADSHTARYMPSMYSEPCAKLTMRLTPKIKDSPDATRNSELAAASPLRNCRRRAAALNPAVLLLPPRADVLVGRLHPGAVGVAPVHHRALAVSLRELADVGAHGRLVIERAPYDRPEGCLHFQALQRFDQLLGVGGLRLADRVGHRIHGGIADHRALARVILPALLIGVAEALVLRRVDLAPRVPGHPPAIGGLVLQRLEVLGLAGDQVEYRRVLEQPARVSFAHEFLQVGGEQRAEDGIGLRLGKRLDYGTGLDLAEGRGLLGDELDAGLRLGEEPLERGGCRLAVLVVRIDDRPAFFLQLGRFGDQHRRLHVSRRAQAEGVAVAVLPDDLVGEGLGGEEQDLALRGKVGHRQADVGSESAHQHVHAVARDQLFGHAHRIARRAAVVAHDQLELAAVDAAAGVDLLERELHAFLVGLQ